MPYQLSEIDILDIALGTGFLGSGGGGDTKIGEIITKNAVKRGAKVIVEKLQNVPDEALVIAVGAMGAPTVLAEKLPSKEESTDAIKKMEEFLNEKIDYAIPAEIGGTNGLYGIYIASQTQKILIDADCMGRAFPEIQMVTPNIYEGIEESVAVLANGKETCILSAENLQELELLARQKTTEMGGTVTIVYMPMRGKKARQCCVPNSISVAQKVGRGVRNNTHLNLMENMNNILQGTEYGPLEQIAFGKIIDLKRELERSFNMGWVLIESLDGEQVIKIDFQNENLRAVNLKNGEVLALVPKIITILDNEFKPLSCECLRIGLDVSVATLQVPEILRTKKALELLVPKHFLA